MAVAEKVTKVQGLVSVVADLAAIIDSTIPLVRKEYGLAIANKMERCVEKARLVALDAGTE